MNDFDAKFDKDNITLEIITTRMSLFDNNLLKTDNDYSEREIGYTDHTDLCSEGMDVKFNKDDIKLEILTTRKSA